MEKYALFTYESLKKTKCREFVPSRDEIEALIGRQEMTSTVYCHGGGSCKITINSHTTAGEVRSGDRMSLEQNQCFVSHASPRQQQCYTWEALGLSLPVSPFWEGKAYSAVPPCSMFWRNPCYKNCHCIAEDYPIVVPSYRRNYRKD